MPKAKLEPPLPPPDTPAVRAWARRVQTPAPSKPVAPAPDEELAAAAAESRGSERDSANSANGGDEGLGVGEEGGVVKKKKKRRPPPASLLADYEEPEFGGGAAAEPAALSFVNDALSHSGADWTWRLLHDGVCSL